MRRYRAGATAAAAAVVTIVFRLLALNGFPNDHFLHLVAARQMLAGEWPTRDFADPGLPLMYAVSAAGQLLLGPTLLAEALLVVMAFGLAAALTVAAVVELTGSVLLGVCATAVEVLIFPRTYGYPKVLLYAAAILLCWRYVRRPGPARVVGLALLTSAAFLFRHDHGLYLAVGCGLTVLLTPEAGAGDRPLRRAILFGAALLAFIAPYLLFVQAYGGLALYLRTGIEFSAEEASRQGRVWPSPLGPGEPMEAVLLYLFHLMPVLALARLAAFRRRGDVRAMAARIVPVAAVAVCVNFGFMRDPLNTRLPDAVVPAALLGVWLVHEAWSATRRPLVWRPVAVGALLAALVPVVVVGNTREELAHMGLDEGWRQIPVRLDDRLRELRDRFSERQFPSRAVAVLQPFFGYLDRCSAADDRLLMAGFLPEVPYYARRPFAGGQSTFVAGYYKSEENQRQVLDRLARQRAPFMLIQSDEIPEFDRQFPLVSAYVRDRYRLMAQVRLDEETTLDIRIDRRAADAPLDAATAWPCPGRTL